jgi:tRNA(adenine34) deaminase
MRDVPASTTLKSMDVAGPSDTDCMRLALDEARAAGEAGDIPIGAVAVLNGHLVARAGNRTIRDCDPTAHAEIVALRTAAKAVGNYRLGGIILFVTIEPCAMCAGAMIQARIDRVVYGAADPKGGAVVSCFQVLDHAALNHRVAATGGVLAAECAALLQSFFASRR